MMEMRKIQPNISTDCQGCPGYYKDFAGSGVSVKIIIRSSDMIRYDNDDQVWYDYGDQVWYDDDDQVWI